MTRTVWTNWGKHSTPVILLCSFAQAMHFQLRTAKEDFLALKRHSQAAAAPPNPNAPRAPDGMPAAVPNGQTDEHMHPQTAADVNGNPQPVPPIVRRQPWDVIEEIMAHLKTAFPLLALSMETVVDQILQRLKPTTDEDIYRLIVALLNDGVQVQTCTSKFDFKQRCNFLARCICSKLREIPRTMELSPKRRK